MAKKHIERKQTLVDTPQGSGKQIVQTFSEDDNVLPSPQELEQFKKVEPRFIDLFIETTRKEQEERHKTQREKIEIIKRDQDNDTLKIKNKVKVKLRGMFYAFGTLFIFVAMGAWALYLDHSWVTAFFSLFSMTALAGIFVGLESDKKEKKTEDDDEAIEITEEEDNE